MNSFWAELKTWRSGLVFALCSVALLTMTVAGAQDTEYKEAPQLASLVEAGQLPPVGERLPLNPLVIEPHEQIGQYGGDWNIALTGGSLHQHMTRFHAYEGLVRFTPQWDGIIPNIAESFEISEDATEYTFHLREGIKWSDGHPFTADDIMFWYEDIFMNDEITPIRAGTTMVHGGEPVVVEKVDDFTVIFRFAEPHGLFLQLMGHSNEPTRHPRHYLEQFHKKYNPDNIDQLAREAGVADWVDLIMRKGVDGADFYRNEDLPVLFAWYLTEPFEAGLGRVVAMRNPYYWKVDPEGNQLPYLDRVVYDLVSDAEVVLLKVLNGEVSLQDQFFATPSNKPVVIDNMARGDYHLYTTIPTTNNEAVIMFNLNHQDPIKREIFQNKDFRIGLSYAINRQDIIDLVFVGQGEPYQAAPRPESEFYNERLARQYTEYNVELANEYLDRAGYSERDRDGFRLGPNGRRISFVIELDAGRLTFVDSMELVREYWEEVGIEAQLRTTDRSLWEVRVREGADFDVTVHRFGGGSGQAVLTDPRYYFPSTSNSFWAAAWRSWFNPALYSPNAPATAPEEPPAATKRQMELYTELTKTSDPARQVELMQEILDIAADEFYVMGISLEANGYGIVKNNFHNVPDTMPWSSTYPHPGPTRPEQFFISGSQ